MGRERETRKGDTERDEREWGGETDRQTNMECELKKDNSKQAYRDQIHQTQTKAFSINFTS